MRPIQLHGHRGARGVRPENTLAGFTHALQTGVDAIEIDVGLTRDDILVVHHDYALSPHLARLDGEWVREQTPLCQLTLAELKRYDVGRLAPLASYTRDFPEQLAVDGERIPTLQEVIDLVIATRADHVRFNIEVKSKADRAGITPPPEVLAARLSDLLRENSLTQRCLVQCFDWRVVLAIKSLLPELTIGFTTCEQAWYDTIQRDGKTRSAWLAGHSLSETRGSLPELIAGLGGNAWMPYHGDVDADSLAIAHGAGLAVMVWTVNDQDDLDRAIALGVDGITTDYPARVRHTLAAAGHTLPPPATLR